MGEPLGGSVMAKLGIPRHISIDIASFGNSGINPLGSRR
jgi:hypothetical protein